MLPASTHGARATYHVPGAGNRAETGATASVPRASCADRPSPSRASPRVARESREPPPEAEKGGLPGAIPASPPSPPALVQAADPALFTFPAVSPSQAFLQAEGRSDPRSASFPGTLAPGCFLFWRPVYAFVLDTCQSRRGSLSKNRQTEA